MFGFEFYPTPSPVIEMMTGGLDLAGKIVLEPSAGAGHIVEYLQGQGARVIACEIDEDLRKILQGKCEIRANDCFSLTSEQVSHIDYVIMNPPFSQAERHIKHMFDIMPPGCKLIALCNAETMRNPYSKSRQEVKSLVEMHGDFENIGDVFSKADRKTDVEVALIRMTKPGAYEQEFEGFFMDDEPEESTGPGLMPFNVVREIVNRYVEAVKIFDQQLETAERLNDMTGSFFEGSIGFMCTHDNKPLKRNEFKRGLQREGWSYIFSKLKMDKYATTSLKEDINKFIERQESVPFTMRNIYHMLDIVIGTTQSRMDKAIEIVFDTVTGYHADNQLREGWKTNSHYLLTRRFIVPSYNFNTDDMVKALCYLTGENYDDQMSLEYRMSERYFLMKDGKVICDSYGWYDHDWKIKNGTWKEEQEKNPGSELVHMTWEYGKWFDWGFFKVRKYKKGTLHFEFKDEKVWGLFNQRVAKLKGYPLHEKKEQTAWQNRQNGYKDQKVKPVILETIKI